MGDTAVKIILAITGSTGLVTAIAALRRGKVDGDNVSMATLNERLNADNLLLRTEVTELRVRADAQRQEITELWLRVTVLERQLREGGQS